MSHPETQPDAWDVIVVGAGHAGCEAALAAAKMGCRTLVLTGNLDGIATMPCNPSIGGPAKGHVVREIDALGGAMGMVTDQTMIQIRMLNTGKGPAVQALRAQADKHLYAETMKQMLLKQPGLTVQQAMITSVRRGQPRADGLEQVVVADALGRTFVAPSVVLTTGTFLQGRLITGESITPGGRAGEAPATGVSESLKALGFSLGRLKTGTPPRIHARSVDFSKTVLQPGSSRPLYFSAWWADSPPQWSPAEPANPLYPPGPEIGWRAQLPCYQVTTTQETHAIIRANLHRAPMFTGVIEGVGPRYCPSIEDKIVRFADKESHGLFLEPEGWMTSEMYLQGANTSLPEDVQEAMVRSIPGLERAEIVRVGYAVEYDFVPPSQTQGSLEAKGVPGLFFAGQVNGTSGYEEAAGQGLMAGINAARRVQRKPPVILGRDQAYIGVMLDDLVTRDLVEPYRLLTSRAEYRLLLRHQTADLRLADLGYQLGLLTRSQMDQVEAKRERIEDHRRRLRSTFLSLAPEAAHELRQRGLPTVERSVSALEYIKRPDVDASALSLFGVRDDPPGVAEEVETAAKYSGYIDKQLREVERVRALEHRPIPDDFDYDGIGGLRKEGRDKLKRFRPVTVGQATRLEGVTPADVSLVVVHLERWQRREAARV